MFHVEHFGKGGVDAFRMGNVYGRPLIRQPQSGCHLPPPGEGLRGRHAALLLLIKIITLM